MCSLIFGQKTKINYFLFKIFKKMVFFKIPRANPDTSAIDYITPCHGVSSRLKSKQIKTIFLKFKYFFTLDYVWNTPHPWVVFPIRPFFLSRISQEAQRTTRPNPLIFYMQLYIYTCCTVYIFKRAYIWASLKLESSNLIIENL